MQRVFPLGQVVTHLLPWHTYGLPPVGGVIAEQLLPHVPQFALSLESTTHSEPHFVLPDGQLSPQLPPVQLAVPPEGASQE